jgi:hypothetical protein
MTRRAIFLAATLYSALILAYGGAAAACKWVTNRPEIIHLTQSRLIDSIRGYQRIRCCSSARDRSCASCCGVLL